jgi:hypothetical protein
MTLGGIGTHCLGLHMINFQGKYWKPVECPGRTFGIYGSVGAYSHTGIFLTKISVYLLNHVGTFLIRTVYAAFQSQRGNRVNLRIAYNVLQVPLNGIYPALGKKSMFKRAVFIRVFNLSINIVMLVICSHHQVKNLIGIRRCTIVCHITNVLFFY